ncbi:MAG: hypothetical protein NVV74_25690 [Magnetospirillum sp.]|nr:hypothetical protein [Magnetospirillum sp.]
MGGFFGGSPSVPSYTPPATVAADPEEEARKQRQESMARNRRGRAGMVATSERGVLTEAVGTGKTLLGE